MLHLQKEGSGTFEDFELETDFIATQLQRLGGFIPSNVHL